MLTPGDVVELDLAVPAGSEAGRRSAAEVVIEPDDDNRLPAPSSAQCQHVRSVATTRLRECIGNVGPVALGEVRETIALLLDL